jgi:hypothetical protein
MWGAMYTNALESLGSRRLHSFAGPMLTTFFLAVAEPPPYAMTRADVP